MRLVVWKRVSDKPVKDETLAAKEESQKKKYWAVRFNMSWAKNTELVHIRLISTKSILGFELAPTKEPTENFHFRRKI